MVLNCPVEQFGADSLSTVFQPVVDISTGSLVAHEALTRASLAGMEVSPAQLFADAHDAGIAAELDAACLAEALAAAAAQGLAQPHSLFVNVEPTSLAGGRVPELLRHAPPLVIEITERALTTHTGALLDAASALRTAGHLIAIDDLGAHPASLALLPLLEPEIVKLDMELIRQRPGRLAATVMTALAAYAESSGAIILAEGVETPRQLVRARALGATLAQGWHFGRPSALAPAAPGVDSHEEALYAPARTRSVTRVTGGASPAAVASKDAGTGPGDQDAHARRGPTPFEVVSASGGVRHGDRELLVQVSKLLEDRAFDGGDTAVLMATFQAEDNITPATRRRYERLVHRGCLLTVYSTGASAAIPEPASNVVVDDDDPLAEEWDVVLLTADFAAALTAREIDPSRHGEGHYEFLLTTDRSLVVRAARALLAR